MALYYPPEQNALSKTLDAQLDSGHTTAMTLNNVTNIQNKPGVVVVNRVDSSGNEKDASDREFIAYTGTSGSTLTGLTRNVDGSSTDQDHAVGSVVEFVNDVTQVRAILDALTLESNDVFLDEDDMSSDSATKGATQQSIKAYTDSGGESQVSFSVYRTGNQTISASTFTKVEFNAEVVDTGGDFDHSTNYDFTVPAGEGGWYLFTVHIRMSALDDGSFALLSLYKDGSIAKRLGGDVVGSGTSNAHVGGSAVVYLSAGEVITLYIYHNSSGDEAVIGSASDSWFSGIKLAG